MRILHEVVSFLNASPKGLLDLQVRGKCSGKTFLMLVSVFRLWTMGRESHLGV